MSTKRASGIEVKGFRHIVLYPFLLRGRPAASTQDPGKPDASMLGAWVREFQSTGLWREQLDNAVHERFSYEQIVYFHPFVRDFLFGDGSDPTEGRSVRILTRDDVKRLEVELGKWQQGVKLRFDVERVELYLCKPCVAIFVVEVVNPRRLDKEEPVKLSHLQDFTDQFRRLYPPFWWDELEKRQTGRSAEASDPGLCLKSLTWLRAGQPDGVEQPIAVEEGLPVTDLTQGETGRQASRTLSTARRAIDEFTRLGAEPPLFAHWQWFFGKNIRPAQAQKQIRPIDGKPLEGLFIQQLLDERMPCMSYYAVDDPNEVSLGDRDRLTFVDASGTDAFPYDETFLEEQRSRHTYSRFAHYNTHYFCSGYGFSMLGRASDFHFRTILPDHFRHHYFCLGLVAHYQRAALLYFADELATSLKDLTGKPIHEELSSPEFRDHVEEIQHRFLKFRTRTYFPEVSNQLQGRELFRLWFEVLETDRLFELVDTASERLTSVLAERESRQLARLAHKATPWLIGLAVASCLFGAAAFIRVENWFNSPDWTFWLVVGVAVLSGVIAKACFWENFDSRHPIRSVVKWSRALRNHWDRRQKGDG